MKQHPKNPYMEMRLAALAKACMAAAGFLEAKTARTPDQRARLAQKVRYLLIAVAWRLTGDKLDYRSPEFHSHMAEREDPRDVFLAYVVTEQRAIRHNALHRCADLMLGEQAVHWLAQAKLDGRPMHEVAAESDEGLARALKAIPAEFVVRR